MAYLIFLMEVVMVLIKVLVAVVAEVDLLVEVAEAGGRRWLVKNKF